MPRRKKVRRKERKRLPDWANSIQELREALGCRTQEELAARLRSKQGTVSTWLRGDETRKPSAEMLIRMAGLAPKPDLASRFLRLADISDEAIFTVARKLETDRFREAAPLIEKGDIVLVDRVRETLQGREIAGPQVPLPKEFVPNPDLTICLVVDEKATAIVDSPKALFILDESEKAAPNLLPFWRQVIFAEYNPESGIKPDPDVRPGIYLGRLALRDATAPTVRIKGLTGQARLYLLTSLLAAPSIWLGGWVHPSLIDLLDATREDPEPEQNPLVIAAQKESRDLVRNELRLAPGWRILGRVVGRLHLEGMQND